VSLHCFVFSWSRCWLISSSCPYVIAECRGSCGCSCDVRFVVRPLRLSYFVTILFLQLLPPLSQPITFTPRRRQWQPVHAIIRSCRGNLLSQNSPCAWICPTSPFLALGFHHVPCACLRLFHWHRKHYSVHRQVKVRRKYEDVAAVGEVRRSWAWCLLGRRGFSPR
jgi:hypothetical protein